MRRIHHHHQQQLHHPQEKRRPARRNKAAAETAAASSSAPRHEHTDRYHNSEIPCCRLLCEIASQVFPPPAAAEKNNNGTTSSTKPADETSSNSEPSSSSSLATLIGEHLLLQRIQAREQQQQQQQQQKNPKKKRKKKKKKKSVEGTASAAEGATTSSTSTTAALTASEQATESTEQRGDQPAATAGTTESQQQQLPPLSEQHATIAQQPSPSAARDRILDRFFDRILADNKSDLSSSSSDDRLLPFLETAALWQSSSSSPSSSDNNNNNNNKNHHHHHHAPYYHVSQDAIRAAIQAIDCYSCKRDVEFVLEINSKLALQPPTTAATTTTDAVSSPNNNSPFPTTTAFDYIAMEEGTAPPLLMFELVSPEGETAGWRLTRSDNDAAISAADLDRIWKDHLLLYGLHPNNIITDAAATTTANTTILRLSDNCMASIDQSCNSRLSEQSQEITAISKELAKLSKKMRDVKRRKETIGNIDPAAFPIQKEADEICGLLLQRLLRIALDVTRSVQCILTHCAGGDNRTRQEVQDDLHWATSVTGQLWKIYMDGVQTCINGIGEYEKELFQFADRQGKVPALFISGTARDLYSELIEVKIRAIRDTLDSTRNLLDHPVSVDDLFGWVASFARKTFMSEAFYQVMAGTAGGGHHQSRVPIDFAVEDVLYTVRELTETIHDDHDYKIKSEHDRRRDKLQRLLDNVDENVAVLAPGNRAEDASNSSSPFAELRKTVSFLKDGEDALDHLGPSIARAANFWVQLGLYHDFYGHGNSRPPVMPLEFRRLMMFGPDDRSESGVCRGGDGQTRATCILVGLFYRWLSDRYMEWKAQLSEQELLAAIEDLEKDTSPKTVKKTKKKKAKTKDRPLADEGAVNGVSSKELVSSETGTLPHLPTSLADSSSPANQDTEDAGASEPLPPRDTGDDDKTNGHASFEEDRAGDARESRPSTETAGRKSEVKIDESKKSQRDAGLGPPSTSTEKPAKAVNESEVPARQTSEKQRPVKAETPTANSISTADNSRGSGGSRARANGDESVQKQQSKKDISEMGAIARAGVYDRSGSFQSAEDFLVGRFLELDDFVTLH